MGSKFVKQCNTGVNYLTGRLNTQDNNLAKTTARPITATQNVGNTMNQTKTIMTGMKEKVVNNFQKFTNKFQEDRDKRIKAGH